MPSQVHVGIIEDVLDTTQIRAAAQDDRCGAVVVFEGVVRNHDSGDGVTSIDYSTHPTAERILGKIAEKIGGKDGVHCVEAWHRIGHLEVGDVAMVVAVAAEHRDQAFQGASDLVDAVKAQLPVWKNQKFIDGSDAWTGLA